MTKDRFIEIMNEDSGNWEGDNVYDGLTIIKKYTSYGVIRGSGDDIIYSENIDILIENGITESDVKELRRLNWMVEDGSYLACFV